MLCAIRRQSLFGENGLLLRVAPAGANADVAITSRIALCVQTGFLIGASWPNFGRTKPE